MLASGNSWDKNNGYNSELKTKKSNKSTTAHEPNNKRRVEENSYHTTGNSSSNNKFRNNKHHGRSNNNSRKRNYDTNYSSTKKLKNSTADKENCNSNANYNSIRKDTKTESGKINDYIKLDASKRVLLLHRWRFLAERCKRMGTK